jgi:hypothetical protein|tara:strand:- start:566 stop:1033 length:468 start_codon:yes stop_codon:yes gene_type:complete
MRIDIERILFEIKMYIPEEVYYNKSTQIALQGVEGKYDPEYGTGRLDTIVHKESDFHVPNFMRMEYTNHILDSLGMYRSRIMKMESKTCYTYHQDPTMRMHIPLVTNENCFIIVDDILHRYPADGSNYLIDTTKMHTAVNASREERIHIVGCVDV